MSDRSWWNGRHIRRIYPGCLTVLRGEDLVLRTDIGVGLFIVFYDEPSSTVAALHAIIPEAGRARTINDTETFWPVTGGFKKLLDMLLETRAMGETRDFHVLIFGATCLKGQPDISLPEQNLAALKTVMKRYSVSATLERTGGQGCRTVFIDCRKLRYAILQNGSVLEQY